MQLIEGQMLVFFFNKKKIDYILNLFYLEC